MELTIIAVGVGSVIIFVIFGLALFIVVSKRREMKKKMRKTDGHLTSDEFNATSRAGVRQVILVDLAIVEDVVVQGDLLVHLDVDLVIELDALRCYDAYAPSSIVSRSCRIVEEKVDDAVMKIVIVMNKASDALGACN
ncbi:unnamed protein product [Notodromas monacha]|uniref:Uncharacterized protein n=1 Tax=Notodromas monacha TaxID=399045 RepID=A0A7R9BJ01_9CRUS|nr:unnamed protein product [Notodromas monacha]CAG0914990.1 unnamed protein product [Notodromas monacha]